MKPENMRENYLNYPKKYFEKYSYSKYPELNLKDIPGFSCKKPFRFPVEVLYLLIINLILFVFGAYLFSRSKLL